MFPSSAIFRPTALIASGYALSLRADSMIGSSSAIAVLGSPFLTASSTFFHRSARGVWAAVWVLTRKARPAARKAAGARRAAGRRNRVMADPEREETGGRRAYR